MSHLMASLGISVEADIVPAAQAGGAFAEMRGSQQSFQMATPGRSFHVGVHLFNGGKLSGRDRVGRVDSQLREKMDNCTGRGRAETDRIR